MKNKNLFQKLFLLAALLTVAHWLLTLESVHVLQITPTGSDSSSTNTPTITSINPNPSKRTYNASNTSLPSPTQKEATKRSCALVAASRASFYEPYGITKQQFTTSCYYDLLAMAYKESRFNCQMIGDAGRSRGCFQIQTKLHHVSIEQAENYEWAATWTIDRMVRDLSYPRFRTAAIKRHNGAGKQADNYAASVKAISERLASAGL